MSSASLDIKHQCLCMGDPAPSKIRDPCWEPDFNQPTILNCLCQRQKQEDARVSVHSLSRVWLFVTPGTVAHQILLSMGFSRQEYWSGLACPLPGDLPNRDQTCISWVSCIGRRVLYVYTIDYRSPSVSLGDWFQDPQRYQNPRMFLI